MKKQGQKRLHRLNRQDNCHEVDQPAQGKQKGPGWRHIRWQLQSPNEEVESGVKNPQERGAEHP